MDRAPTMMRVRVQVRVGLVVRADLVAPVVPAMMMKVRAGLVGPAVQVVRADQVVRVDPAGLVAPAAG